MAARKNQGGGDPVALLPEPAEAVQEPAFDYEPVLAPLVADAPVGESLPSEPPATFTDLFRREFNARVRFEIVGAGGEIRLTGLFGDIGCSKTWTFDFRPGWDDEAMATVRAWKALRLAQAI